MAGEVIGWFPTLWGFLLVGVHSSERLGLCLSCPLHHLPWSKHGLAQSRCSTNSEWGPSLVVQWLRIHLPMQGMQVRSPVRELRLHVPWSNEAHEPQPVSLCALEPARDS